jgi:hypothetical protein
MNPDRNKLIEKLRTVKDPRERDRIMWALSGLEKDAAGDTPMVEDSRKTVSSPLPEQKQSLPAIPTGLRQLFAYFVPGLFLLFGIINLLEALVHTLSSGEIETVIPQLIIGSLFILFGITGIVKARKKVSGTEQEAQAGDNPS